MKVRSSLRCLWACAVVAIAVGSDAQHSTAQNQEESRPQTGDRLAGSRLVGTNDDLAMELPNGELIAFYSATGRWCLPPVARGGVIKVDCTVEDGPAYYFDESTRALIEACSFWFPDLNRCPPKEWPIEVPDCDGALPEGIAGTWRFAALPGAGGLSSVDGGWTMTLADGAIHFDFHRGAPIARSYVIVDHVGQRYSLELRDPLSDTTTIDVELAPCGLLIDAADACDAFCNNMNDEVGRPTDEQLREMLADRFDANTIERLLAIVRDEAERGPRPLFPPRSYFRESIK